jgi:hypothetical protein
VVQYGTVRDVYQGKEETFVENESAKKKEETESSKKKEKKSILQKMVKVAGESTQRLFDGLGD